MIYIKTKTEKIIPQFQAYDSICEDYRHTNTLYKTAVQRNMNIELIAALKSDLIKLEGMKEVAEKTLLQYAPKIESILNQ